MVFAIFAKVFRTRKLFWICVGIRTPGRASSGGASLGNAQRQREI
jgi:hypothetical protein